MKLVLSLLALASLGLLHATPAIAAAGPDYKAFTAACKANPGYLESAAAYFDGAEKGIVEYCGCLVEQYGDNLSQSDVDLLAKDLDGTLTDQERMAYQTYEDLQFFIAPLGNDCMVISGLADGYDPGEVAD